VKVFNLIKNRAIIVGLSGSIACLGIYLIPVSALSESVKVGTKSFAPFAFVQDGRYIGFSIDLWEKIAEELQLDYKIYGEKTVNELLNSVSSGNTDIAIAGITITADREKIVVLQNLKG
jgi:ABC-type amino acid transport substrate-binding protein